MYDGISIDPFKLREQGEMSSAGDDMGEGMNR